MRISSGLPALPFNKYESNGATAHEPQFLSMLLARHSYRSPGFFRVISLEKIGVAQSNRHYCTGRIILNQTRIDYVN